jgi:hypothetical protein
MAVLDSARHGRLSARLSRLPHEVLADFCATLCCERRDACTAADALLAEHDPLPAWATAEVVLSPDLAPNLMAPLDLVHGAAACVCKTWLVAWDATSEGRRGLCAPTPMHLPNFELVRRPQVIASPNGERLCIAGSNCLRLFDRRVETLQDLHPFDTPRRGIGCAMSDDSLYAILDEDDTAGSRLVRYEFDGTGSPVAAFESPGLLLTSCMAFAPNNLALIFCVPDETETQTFLGFDARTLEERFRFEVPIHLRERDIGDMTVVADEVFCADPEARCLHVFSLSGEHLRDVRGPFREPCFVEHYNGRLFVCEYPGRDEEEWAEERGPNGEVLREEDWSAEKKAAGRRIFVLTPQGETLQVFDQFPTTMRNINSMTVAGNRLVVVGRNRDSTALFHGTVYELKGA